MHFAQLAFRESLCDLEVSLGAVPARIYHLGLRHPVSRSTLANANGKRPWRINADFALWALTVIHDVSWLSWPRKTSAIT